MLLAYVVDELIVLKVELRSPVLQLDEQVPERGDALRLRVR